MNKVHFRVLYREFLFRIVDLAESEGAELRFDELPKAAIPALDLHRDGVTPLALSQSRGAEPAPTADPVPRKFTNSAFNSSA